mmetsp:Transcript_118841/g.236770  ORF Transcript_118841/g.236770 Transcript_118841/m.236770 type:complete len:602 (-) Transcript_118841:236-2041(-)
MLQHSKQACVQIARATRVVQRVSVVAPPWQFHAHVCATPLASRPQLHLTTSAASTDHEQKGQEAFFQQANVPGSERINETSALFGVAPGSAVYANPICSQLDQLLIKCEDVESVLVLLVTHRGVFFVHNLITAMQVLGGLADEAGVEIMVNALLRDPRYDLLIRDLIRFVPKLDFLAMANVACSLRQLGHKHYMLLSRMLRPMLLQTIPDVPTLLRCMQAYTWAGYQQQHDFFSHGARVLAEASSSLPVHQILQASVLYGNVAQYNGTLFRAMENALLSRELIEHELSPHEVSLMAWAFTAHLQADHDDLLVRVSGVLDREAPGMDMIDIVRCMTSFRRVALHLEHSIQVGLSACMLLLQRAWLVRRRLHGVQVTDVAMMLDTAAFFGIQVNNIKISFDYLEDYVDEIDDRASIQIVHAMCVFGGVSTHARLLLYLFRKVGAGTAWDGQRARIFQLWISQLLQFPWLDAKLPKRCINEGLRAWSLHRRGFGCPFPEEVRAISADLMAMGVGHQTFVPVPDTPYEVDIVIGHRKDGLLIVSETSRNTFGPVGSTLLQMRHLNDRGWHCIVMPRAVWRRLGTGEESSDSRRTFLRAVIQGFEI